MARLLAIVIWSYAFAVAALFAWSQWQLPEAITAHSRSIDGQYKLTMIVIGCGFFIIHFLLAFCVWKYRARKKAIHSTGDSRIEISLTAFVLIIFMTLGVAGQRVWGKLQLNRAPSGAVQIEVFAQQFAWNFRHPGADGEFGRAVPELYNDSDNSIGARPGPIGIDPNDPAGDDDIVSGKLVIPVGRPVKLTLRAKDVTHDFYVPALRLKHDAVPGMKIDIHFSALKEGRYEIACAELCGQLHHQMRAFLEVRSIDDFQTWINENSRKIGRR